MGRRGQSKETNGKKKGKSNGKKLSTLKTIEGMGRRGQSNKKIERKNGGRNGKNYQN